jgi:hypothetical protein
MEIAQNYRKKRKIFTITNSVKIQMQKKHLSLSSLVPSEHIPLKLDTLKKRPLGDTFRDHFCKNLIIKNDSNFKFQKTVQGDGTKTRKRFRRAVQNERRKALELERPEIRQLLEAQRWIPKKHASGWWLRDGCWLCKRCAHMNVGSNKFCFGCDLPAPDPNCPLNYSIQEQKFYTDPNFVEMSRIDGNFNKGSIK